jgi:outer membrane protein assembly factor BamA
MKSERHTPCASIRAFILMVFLFTMGFQIAASAQTTRSTSQNPGGPPRDLEEGFAVSPIPIVKAVTEEGAGVALEYKYRLDPNSTLSSSSATAVGGFITSNRSWGAGLYQTLFFHDDRWRMRFAGSYSEILYNYYGIGTAAGEAGGHAGISELTFQRGVGTLGDVLFRLGEMWYVGPQYRFIRTKARLHPNPQFDPAFADPVGQDTHVGMLGPRIMRDSRSDANYPRDGSLFDLRALFMGEGTGSQLTYQTYNLSYAKFLTTAPRQVLAMRGATCVTRGTTPFWDQCIVTSSENLRGYKASRYRDDNYFAAQAEYRWEAWKRLGFVGFGGVGQVAPKYTDFNWGNLLPGYGAGVRYRITRESHVNIRFDYAWGKHSREGYLYIGEAF